MSDIKQIEAEQENFYLAYEKLNCDQPETIFAINQSIQRFVEFKQQGKSIASCTFIGDSLKHVISNFTVRLNLREFEAIPDCELL